MPYLRLAGPNRLVGRSSSEYEYSHLDIGRRFFEDAYGICKAAFEDSKRTLLRVRSVPIENARPSGAASPSAFGAGMLVLFCSLFTIITLLAVWFFAWSKNGGFKFKKTDFSDYVSNVSYRVKRKVGSDGKTVRDSDGRTVFTETNTFATDLGVDDIRGDLESNHPGAAPLRRGLSDLVDTEDEDMASYRQEKVARVGGLNRKPDGSYIDYNPTSSNVTGQSRTVIKVVKKKVPPKKKLSKERESIKRYWEHIKETSTKIGEGGAQAADSGFKAGARVASVAIETKRGFVGFFSGYYHAIYPEPVRRAHKELRAKVKEPVYVQKTGQNRNISNTYSFTTGDDGTTVDGSSYVSQTHAKSQHPPPPPSHSYFSSHASSRHTEPYRDDPSTETGSVTSYTEGDDSSYFTGSRTHTKSYTQSGVSERDFAESLAATDDDVESKGTKAYRHVIPGIVPSRQSGQTHSLVRQVIDEEDIVSERSHINPIRSAAGGGYRRGGGGGRRDSLSDSDGE
jgi:hypothetical protein